MDLLYMDLFNRAKFHFVHVFIVHVHCVKDSIRLLSIEDRYQNTNKVKLRGEILKIIQHKMTYTYNVQVSA